MNPDDDVLGRIRGLLGSPDQSPSQETPKADQYLGKYRIVREIARGGMGIVFEAEDLRLNRRVALKVLKDGLVDLNLIKRLQREAQLAAKLRHPNIVGVHEVDELETAGGGTVHYIAMDLIIGPTLADLMRPDRKDPKPFLEILRDVARAVGFAHSQGIIHRDLKPANVLIEESTGRVVLTDFGLARSNMSATSLTRTQAVLGTPQYMAPEQVKGKNLELDARTDVYALGIILYEILTGSTPFKSDTPVGIFQEILNAEPELPRRQSRSIPVDLELICMKAMERERHRRYATAAEFADDLDHFLNGEPVKARPASAFYRFRKRLAKNKLVLVTMVCTLAAAGLVAAMFLPTMLRAKRDLGESLVERQRDQLAAALDLRRAGKLDRMKELAAKSEELSRTLTAEYPDRPEPHYALGRIYRALMRNDDALREQDLALKKVPTYAPSLYERVVLILQRYRSHMTGLVLASWQVRSLEGIPSWDELERSDARARKLKAVLVGDLKALENGKIGDRELLCARGLLAAANGKFADVREILGRVILDSNAPEEAFETLASVEFQMGNYPESIRIWTAGHDRDLGYLPHLAGRATVHGAVAGGLSSRGEDPVASLDLALKDQVEFLKLDPTSGDLFTRRAMTEVSYYFWLEPRNLPIDEHVAEALRCFEEGLRLQPELEQGRLGRGFFITHLALHYGARGGEFESWFERAVDDLQIAQRMNPDSILGWELLGNAYVGWGMQRTLKRRGEAGELFQKSVATYDEAIRRGPGRYTAWNGRGAAKMNWAGCLMNLNQDPQPMLLDAIHDLDEALRLAPTLTEASMQRGRTYMNLGSYTLARGGDARPLFASALADFDRVVTSTSGGEAYMGRGSARAHLAFCADQRQEECDALYVLALKDLTQATTQNPKSSDFWGRRGGAVQSWAVSEARRGIDPTPHFVEAIDNYDKAVKGGGATPDTLGSRGASKSSLAVWKMQHKEDGEQMLLDAIADLDAALLPQPNNVECLANRAMAHTNLAVILITRGDDATAHFKAALADAEKVVGIAPFFRERLEPVFRMCNQFFTPKKSQ